MIAGVSTAVTAMIGQTISGPVNVATRLTSWVQFQNAFGALSASLELGYSVMLFFTNGGGECWVVRTLTDIDPALIALNAVSAVNIICVPGVSDPDVQSKVVQYCQTRQAFALLDTDRSAAAADGLLQYARSAGTTISENAALYGPWIEVVDPTSGKARASAPSGAVAGLYARNDAGKGVWHSPAGRDAGIIGATSVQFSISDAENALLDSAGVNVIRMFPGAGPVVWGARTRTGADGSDSDYKYVPVKRMALFLEQSVRQGLQWIAFEPNDTALWAKVTQSVLSCVMALFQQGAFQGSKPQQAFWVRCDGSTTTQADISRGVVNVVLGFAPLKPAEFIVLQIQLIAGKR